IYSDHIRCLLSLKPAQRISDIVRILKGESSPASRFWQAGYLAKTVGSVQIEKVKRYIQSQSQHHGYAERTLPPVYRFRAQSPVPLTAPHATFDLSYHLVFSTRYRKSVFGAALGEQLTSYWLKVASVRSFAIDR